MTNPASHEAHDLPLADRIVSDLIADYLDTATSLALAGFGDVDEHERGARDGIRQMRHLHLDGWDYKLTPKIIDALRRAGLLTKPTTEDRL